MGMRVPAIPSAVAEAIRRDGEMPVFTWAGLTDMVVQGKISAAMFAYEANRTRERLGRGPSLKQRALMLAAVDAQLGKAQTLLVLGGAFAAMVVLAWWAL